jgi:hypothetical protein
MTFSSPTGESLTTGDGIYIHDCGRIDGDFLSRQAARRSFRRRVEGWKRVHRAGAIVAACPFGYLEGLRIRERGVPVVFLYYEVYDANVAELRQSPATAVRNWRALRRLDEATIICVPSAERAGWLVARAGLRRLPNVVLNSPSASLSTLDLDMSAVGRLLPDRIRQKRLVINTGGVSKERGLGELVSSVAFWRQDAALVVTNVGQSPYADEVRRLATASCRRDDILLLPLLPRHEMLALQRASAVGTSLMRGEDLDTMLAAPNKIGEYLHAGLVVVASRGSFTERLEDRGVAVLANTLEPQEIARTVNQGLDQAAHAGQRERALAAAREWYCMDVQLRPVLRALDYA